MERFRQIGYKILFPGPAVVGFGAVAAAALLGYVFAFAREDSPIAYPAYVLSAYALTIACAWAAKSGKRAKKELEAIIHKIPLAHRCLTDLPFRLHVSLYLALGFNVLYAGLKFGLGVYYHSVWFGTLAVYYFLLAVMRFMLLRHAKRKAFGAELISELEQFRMCGVILLLMNVALLGVVVLVVRKNEGFQYAGYLIYVMAMYAFYNMITAVRNVVKFRQFNSPVMSAAKVINLASALVSMLALETAMLNQFSKETDPEAFRQVMTAATGGCVCVMVLAIAVYMIARSTRQIGRLRTQALEEGEEKQ